jgi:hypothetical protein
MNYDMDSDSDDYEQPEEVDPDWARRMMEEIETHWIPFVEDLEFANGRKAFWNKKRSVIMYEGDDI